MAKKSSTKELVDRLHAGGVRKRAARLIAEASDGRRKPAKSVRAAVRDLGRMVDEAEDLVSGGPAKRRTAARKAAATRRRHASRRSTAAKKAARTRARSRA